MASYNYILLLKSSFALAPQGHQDGILASRLFQDRELEVFSMMSSVLQRSEQYCIRKYNGIAFHNIARHFEHSPSIMTASMNAANDPSTKISMCSRARMVYPV